MSKRKPKKLREKSLSKRSKGEKRDLSDRNFKGLRSAIANVGQDKDWNYAGDNWDD